MRVRAKKMIQRRSAFAVRAAPLERLFEESNAAAGRLSAAAAPARARQLPRPATGRPVNPDPDRGRPHPRLLFVQVILPPTPPLQTPPPPPGRARRWGATARRAAGHDLAVDLTPAPQAASTAGGGVLSGRGTPTSHPPRPPCVGLPAHAQQHPFFWGVEGGGLTGCTGAGETKEKKK